MSFLSKIAEGVTSVASAPIDKAISYTTPATTSTDKSESGSTIDNKEIVTKLQELTKDIQRTNEECKSNIEKVERSIEEIKKRSQSDKTPNTLYPSTSASSNNLQTPSSGEVANSDIARAVPVVSTDSSVTSAAPVGSTITESSVNKAVPVGSTDSSVSTSSSTSSTNNVSPPNTPSAIDTNEEKILLAIYASENIVNRILLTKISKKILNSLLEISNQASNQQVKRFYFRTSRREEDSNKKTQAPSLKGELDTVLRNFGLQIIPKTSRSSFGIALLPIIKSVKILNEPNLKISLKEVVKDAINNPKFFTPEMSKSYALIFLDTEKMDYIQVNNTLRLYAMYLYLFSKYLLHISDNFKKIVDPNSSTNTTDKKPVRGGKHTRKHRKQTQKKQAPKNNKGSRKERSKK